MSRVSRRKFLEVLGAGSVVTSLPASLAGCDVDTAGAPVIDALTRFGRKVLVIEAGPSLFDDLDDQGIENLWATDGSLFPTSSGYNPTHTIVALATRVADDMVFPGSPERVLA